MSKWLIRGAVALGGLVLLWAGVVVAYDRWGEGPRAERLADDEKYDEAVVLYDKAIARHFWTSYYRAYLLTNRAHAYYSTGKAEAALKDLNEALTLEPKFTSALTLRSNVYEVRLNWAAAEKDIDKAIALEPGNSTFYTQRAWLHEATLDYDKAIADYAAVAQLNPQARFAFLQQALNYAQKGDKAKAVELLETTTMNGGYSAEGYVRRGNRFDNIEAHDRALMDYAQAIRLAPNNPVAYVERGTSYGATGNHALALKDFARALELDPDNISAYYSRGRDYYLTGDYDKARSDLKRTLELEGENLYVPIWLHMANAHLGIDDRKALKDQMSKAKYQPWPWPVLNFYGGNIDETAMRAAASANESPAASKAQLCEANYYAGSLYLAQDNRAKALPLLRDAATNCPLGFVELYAARLELKSLGE